MDEKSLDELLRQRQAAAASSLPPNFQQDVWREIRLRRCSDTPETFWWRWLLRPQVITGLLGVAMFVGIGLGSRQHDRVAFSTTQALHLDVFGAAAPALPSTVLASNL